MARKEFKEEMTVMDAGRIGGITTKERYSPGYYVNIGKKGGQKVHELIERGKEAAERR